MKTKFSIVTCVLLLGSIAAFAQQDPAYSQYMFNTLLINPAYAGSRDVVNVTSLYRQQWSAIEGAPKTFSFAADMPVYHERAGLGLVSTFDKVGVVSVSSTYGQFAYRVHFSGKGTLSVGASGGVQYYAANLSSVNYKIPGNTHADPAFDANVSKWVPNFGLGLYYATDKFYAGLSVPHVLNNSLTNNNLNLAISEVSSAASQYRHYMLVAGFVKQLSPSWAIKPSTLVKAVSGAPVQFDLNTNFWYENIIGLGVSYRTASAVVGMVEIQANSQLRIGYAYDYATTVLNKYSNGSHEIMLRYEFGEKKGKMLTPRYF